MRGIAVVVLLGLLVGCGPETEDDVAAGAGAATSVVPSALSFHRTVIPSTQTLTAVAAGNGKVVAVGKAATVEISTTDGAQWSVAAVSFAGDVQSIVFSARTHLFYILVTDLSPGTAQHIYSSPDGKRWTALSSLALVGHATLSLANDRFFVSGHDSATGAGTVYSSADAKAWTRSPTSLLDGFFDEVVFGAGRFAAHASDEDGNSAVWISTDGGATWLRTHQLGQGGTAIAFGAGRFVAGRDRRLEASTDGITWTVVLDTEGATFSTLLFNSGFRAFDIGGAIWTSADGLAWTQTAGSDFVSVFDVAVSGGTYVAVGDGGSLATTTTLSSWTVIDQPGGVPYVTIAFGSGKFVMADRGRLQTSTDAVNWQTVVPLDGQRNYERIKHVQNSFFAIYECGSDNEACIADSNDGINWLHVLAFSEEKPRDVAFGNGKYVMVQRQGFITNFTAFCCIDTFNRDVFELPIPDSFAGVEFCNGQFVAVADGGQTATSTDATNWTVHDGTGLANVTSLAFGKGVFVAATTSGVFASTNGASFTRVFSPPAGAANNQVRFANQLFFYTGDAGFLASSADGRAWTVVPTGTSDTVFQVAFGNALYVAAGDHNTVLTSK